MTWLSSPLPFCFYLTRLSEIIAPTHTILLLIGFGICVPLIGLSGLSLLDHSLKGDLVIGTLMSNFMPPAISIVYASAIIAAVLTTANSSLLSCSMCFTRDFYYGFINRNASNQQLIWVSRCFIAVASLICFIIAKFAPSIIALMLIVYTLASLAAVPMILGLFWKKPGPTAAFWSIILGSITVIIWQILGQPFGIHIALVGLPVSIITFILGTYFGKKPTEEQQSIVGAPLKE